MYESKRKKLSEGNLKAKDTSLESVEIFKEISKILVEYCGEEAQTAEHILQRCELYKELRVRTWPQPTLEAQKLYGCLTDLQRTAAFISETGLTI